MKYRVSLVQPNFQQGPKWLNIFFLPYSVGCVWVYAQTHQDVRDRYELDRIIWNRIDIDRLAQDLADNRVVMFSTYVWNRKYNYALAQKIKKINPDVFCMFGGPEPSISDPDIFDQCPFIDAIIKREGELVVTQVLQTLDRGDLAQVPGLILNHRGTRVDTGEAGRIDDLSKLPSPYLTGLFDDIMRDNPHVTWNMTLETNRGCPFQCTFCDWGSLTYSKIRKFPIERVYAELSWAEKNVTGIYFADANFGVFPDRDRGIVQHLLQAHKNNPMLSYVYINWAKNQRNDVVAMVKMMSQHPGLISNGLTVSTQSMTPVVLDIIKRTNLEQHKIAEIYEITRQENVSAYTELILGLPGETMDSFQDSVFQLMEMGIHNGIEINQAQLFSNAEMHTVQRSMYDIQTVEISDYLTMYQDHNDELVETVSVVCATDTLTFDQNINLNLWVSFMHAFHFHGFTTQISCFLHRYCGVSYKEFYSQLFDEIKQHRDIQQALEIQTQHIQAWFRCGHIPQPHIKDINFNGMNLLGGITLWIHTKNLLDQVFEILDNFISMHYMIDNEIKNQLLRYQKDITITYQKISDNTKITRDYAYDFARYIEHGSRLDQPCRLTFDLKPIQRGNSYEQFLDNIFFKRRQRMGILDVKTQYLNG